MHRLLLHQTTLQPCEVQVASCGYGCNMRTLYGVLAQKDDTIMRHLRERLKQYDLSTIHKMLTSGDQLSGHTSHSIVTTMCQDQPNQDKLRTCMTTGSPTLFLGLLCGMLSSRHTPSRFSAR